jgi:hypothetical protein
MVQPNDHPVIVPREGLRPEKPDKAGKTRYDSGSESQINRRRVMSAKNGDKSRHQINRTRAVLRRAKMRDMVKAAKAGAAAKAEVK